jgi:DNA-directed RNA polymerase subunit omega
MARITVEDCIDKFPSRFELVLVASQRARKLHSGDNPTIEKDNDKNTVIALREIGDSAISVNDMKENLIQEYQTVTINDEEEENFQLESSNSVDSEDTTSAPSLEVEKEMEDLVKSEDSEIESQYEITENPLIEEDDEVQNESLPIQENEEIQAESDKQE